MKGLLIALLVGYKRWVSPTCSEYARLALIEQGLWRGSLHAASRLLRCQPFGAGGIDLPASGRR